LFGWWSGTRFWSVRDALRTGTIKTGFTVGKTVHRSTDPRVFALVMRWRVLGGTLWAAVALLSFVAIAQVL
jgi:hypothetical protein